MKSTVSIAALCGLVGCAPSFMDRHDLLGFRIAAVGVEDGYASAAIWSGRLFHEAPPLLELAVSGRSSPVSRIGFAGPGGSEWRSNTRGSSKAQANTPTAIAPASR